MTEVFSRLLGKNVGNASEEWRHECECAGIMRMPGLERRQHHLREIEKIRGKPAADKIKADIMRLHNAGIR